MESLNIWPKQIRSPNKWPKQIHTFKYVAKTKSDLKYEAKLYVAKNIISIIILIKQLYAYKYLAKIT